MKYIILGAGPAGLTIANYFLQNGVTDFLVLEKESTAGGLCRSEIVDGSPLDIGGGHFLDVRRPKVNSFLFGFMPVDLWDLFERNSQISIDGQYIHHPFEANIWNFTIDEQIEYLKSIANAGCNRGTLEPNHFTEWIRWKLGDRIAEKYMLPYNSKIFGNELDNLGTYWLNKLPSVSFEDTLRSCLEKKFYGTQPGHAKFYYPKEYGYGEIWLRMANKIGEKIIYNSEINCLDAEQRLVHTKNGRNYSADTIITTIPWKSIEHFTNVSDYIIDNIMGLKHSSIEVRYFPNKMKTDAQWIYYPEMDLPYHRILVRHNFCFNSKGYWTETNLERKNMFISDTPNYVYVNQYAYPLNTIEKPKQMREITDWFKRKGIIPLGRWGEHEHYNSDLTVERALELGAELLN